MPIPHHNVVCLNGMGQKNDYLIWRESDDGFFTALEAEGDIYVWSMGSGELLYKH